MKRMLLIAGIAVLLIGSLSICGNTSTKPVNSVVRGGSITVAKTNKMTTLYPPKTNTRIEDGYVFGLVYEPLIGYDENGNFSPRLATFWEFGEDGKTIVMKLRKGVKFHDGTDFNAKAVKFNLEWFISEECGHVYRTSELSNITSVDVIDDYTVQVNLSTPDAALLSVFTNISGLMISPTAIKKGTDYFAVNAVGTGPFRVGEYIEGDHITLVANKDYYEFGEDAKSLPYLDQIVFRFMVDDLVKTTNLQSGDVDIVDYHSSTNSINKAKRLSNLTTVMTSNRETYFICFNQNDPLLHDVKVRQALSYAVNRQELMDAVLEGIGIVEPFDATSEQWFFNDYNPYKYDPDKAKTLLAEAGYPEGITVTLSFIAREPDATMCQLLQEQLKASNINLKLEALERLAWIDLIRTNRSGQLGIGVISIQGLDPNQQYNSTLVYVDPKYVTEIQSLLLSAKRTFVVEERKSILAQYQKDYLDNAYYVFLGQRPRYISHNNRLNDVRLNPNGTFDLKWAWVSK